MSYAPQSDTELKTQCRALTGYEDDPEELPASQLKTLVDVAKMNVANQSGADNWYSDDALAQALLFTLCIRTKESVENYSVTAWNPGDEEIDVSGAGDSEAAQFQHWANNVSSGISESENGSLSSHSVTNSSGYIG